MKLKSGSIYKTFKGVLVEYFIVRRSWRNRLAMSYNRYQQGNARINILKDLMVILGIGGLISGVDLSFIPFWAFIFIAIFWLWMCYTIGYLDEKYGFWKEQMVHLTGEIDPIHKDMCQDIKEIKNILQNGGHT